MSLYEYGSAASGLQFTINTVANPEWAAPGFTVHVIQGSLNLNALYWSDGERHRQGKRIFRLPRYEVRERVEHERFERGGGTMTARPQPTPNFTTAVSSCPMPNSAAPHRGPLT